VLKKLHAHHYIADQQKASEAPLGLVGAGAFLTSAAVAS
jgi:hypothetical protein